ncbi:MAG: OmpA family protein [Pseudomonadota bacterium]
MKKILLSVFLAAAVSASEYNYEVSAMGGEGFSNNSQELKDHTVYGAEIQLNDLDIGVKPELSIFYSNADYNGRGDTNIFRSALSGIYEFEKSNSITPFVKAGVGYETMSNHQYDNHDSPFADAGAGVKIALLEQLSLKLEVINMLKFNSSNWDNNLLLLAGLNFAFGEKMQPIASVAAPAVEAPVILDEPKENLTPVIAAATYPIDSDKDGVFDPQDKCPNTPSGFKVAGDGCPLTAKLHITFATDSNSVDKGGTDKISEFAAFMEESPAYQASIIGHTDATGSVAYNQKLSEKRAETIKDVLVKDGVEADRLTTSGKGEMSPVSSNKTPQGRTENRRIEVELSD